MVANHRAMVIGKNGGQMLILTRRTGQTIYIDFGTFTVTVTVLGVRGATAKIGIDAPKNVPVHRQEIYERIKRELSGEPSSEPSGNR